MLKWDEDAYPVQRDSVEWLRHRTEAFVWLRLGGGKTAVALMAALEWSRMYGFERLLVVGPTKVIRDTWGTEIATWDTTCHLSYAAAIGPMAHRVKAIASKPDVLGVNYENLQWLYRSGYKLPEMVCLDEGHKMKSHASKRFKEHRKHVLQFKRRLMLSATPAREGYEGLWAEEASISKIQRLGRNITDFRERFCTTIDRDQGRYAVSPYARAEIERLIDPITWNPDPATYADLTEPVVSDELVPMTKKLRDEYTYLEHEFILEVEKLMGEGKDVVEAVNSAVLKNKLRQVCGGFIYDDHQQAIPLDMEKLDALEELLENLNGEPAVIWYAFQWERDMILNRLPFAETLAKDDVIERWDREEIPYLVAHPASGGEGLNLHKPCRNIVWYALPWSGLQYEQANGRVDRGHAQKKEVRIYRLMRERSVEQEVAALLSSKEALEAGLMARVGRH